jgi:two-component system, response regulator
MDSEGVILLIEDDEDHAMLVTLAFENLDIGYKIHWVKNGKEAMDDLYRRGMFINPEDCPRPDLILLDLRLPVIDGHEVLKATKEACDLRVIPVVILTTSQNKADIMRAYSNYANSYLVKPMSSETLVEMIGSLGVYWLKWNQRLALHGQNQTG